MNGRIIRAIAIKDLKEVRQNRMAWMPALIVPVVFCIILPLLVIAVPQIAGEDVQNMMFDDPDIQLFLKNLPPSMLAQVEGLNDQQMMIVFVLGFMFAPLFLILPIMVASAIGADSFVGEKERKTMEALLYTPVTERDLFFGKMVAAVIPAIVLTWGAFVVYTLMLNVTGAPVMGRVWFPLPAWWPLILWVTPAVAVMGMAGAVFISSRVNTFIEAYQSTGLLVLPVILLVVAQVGGVIYLSVEVVLVVGLVIWLIDAALLWTGAKLFSRTRLMGSPPPQPRKGWRVRSSQT